MVFSCLVGLRAEVGSGGTALREVAGEDRVNEGAEYDLSTAVRYINKARMI